MRADLSALATDPAGQLDVLGHDGHTLGVDGAEGGVLEEADEVRFRCLLEGHDGNGLETQVAPDALGDFADESLERKLADEKLRGLLVLADLPKRNGTWAVPICGDTNETPCPDA